MNSRFSLLIALLLSSICFSTHGQSFVWGFTFGPDFAGGGPRADEIVLDPAGNIYTAGSFSGEAYFDPVAQDSLYQSIGTDVLITKYDPDGGFLWAKHFGSPGSQNHAMDIAIDANGDLFVTGYFENTLEFSPAVILTSNGHDDGFLAKFDNDGNIIWAFSFGNAAIGIGDSGFSVGIDSNDDVVLTGAIHDQVDLDPSVGVHLVTAQAFNWGQFLAKYNGTTGSLIWAFDMCPSSIAYTFQENPQLVIDGSDNIFVTGDFSGSADFDPSAANSGTASQGSTDGFLAKYSSLGALMWVQLIGSTSNDQAYGICLDPSDNVFMSGRFSGTVDFDPGPGESIYTVPIGMDPYGYIIKFDNNGMHQWSFPIEGRYLRPTNLAADNNGLYVTGVLIEPTDFDPVGDFVLSPFANNEPFLARYTATGDFGWAFHMETTATFWNGYGRDVALDNEFIVLSSSIPGYFDMDPGPDVVQNIHSGDFSFSLCKYESCALIEPPICDGQDNNCNGLIDETAPDTDLDTLSDCVDNCPSTANMGQEDWNADGIGDACQDTDGDGLLDEEELNTYFTDPAEMDSDGDGLSDGDEVLIYLTNPNTSDTDGDLLSDFDEVFTTMTNPLLDDSDGDNLLDGEEVNDFGTDPNLADTDGDGLNDDEEILVYLTDPLDIDTDLDGLEDGDEVLTYFTDPHYADVDGDGLTDSLELFGSFTDPNNPDTDGDGCNDNLEYTYACPDSVFDNCPQDFDDNGIVDTADLLIFLGIYGSTCP